MDEFHIELLDIHWLKDTPEKIDLCAHGQVKVIIGKETIVEQQEDDIDWTLNAMALHLLRTLESNHLPENLVGEHLIPCCGHHIDHIDGEQTVSIQGCFTGHNWWVRHSSNTIELQTLSNNIVELPFNNYKDEVLKFVDSVKEFYNKSKKKQLPDDDYDRTGYLMFWNEWNNRRAKWK